MKNQDRTNSKWSVFKAFQTPVLGYFNSSRPKTAHSAEEIQRLRLLIKKSGLFDKEWYLSKYPDVARAGVDPVEHYITHGASERRNPSRYFNTESYLRSHPTLDLAVDNPLLHYHRRVLSKIRKSDLFNKKWYLAKYPDVAKAKVDPLEHYLKFGALEGRNPSAKFNTRSYLLLNHDIDPAAINPLFHYIEYGKKERRKLTLPVKQAVQNAELAMAKKDYPAAIRFWQIVMHTGGKAVTADTYKNLSIAYRCARLFADAENTILKAKGLYKKNILLYIEHAEIAMTQRHWDIAIERWRNIIGLFAAKAGVGVYLRMSICYRCKHEFDIAETIVLQGLTRHQNRIELLSALAEIAMVQRNWMKAAYLWQSVFDRLRTNKALKDLPKYIKPKVPDWDIAHWFHLAQFIVNNQSLFLQQNLNINFHLNLTAILRNAKGIDDACNYIRMCCDLYPDSMQLTLKYAELTTLLKNWPETIKARNTVFAKYGENVKAEIYIQSGLTYYTSKNHNAASAIIKQGSIHHPQLTELDKELVNNDLILSEFRDTRDHKHEISINLICYDPGSIFYNQIKYGHYLTKTEISARINNTLGIKMGAIDASWTGRFTRGVSRRLARRYGSMYQNSKLSVDTLADAMFYALYTELSTLLPMRHLARRISVEAGSDPVYIEINSTNFSYLNYWGPCDLESIYLYVELKKRGTNAFLCINEKAFIYRENTEHPYIFRFIPSARFSSKPYLHHTGMANISSHKAIVPDGIRGIDKVVEHLGDVHILTSTQLTLSRPYDVINPQINLNFTASIYNKKTLPKEVTLAFNLVKEFSSSTVNNRKVITHIFTSSAFNPDLFQWLHYVFGEFLDELVKNATDFVSKNDIRELHICDHFFMDSAILTPIVKNNKGRVILWPHSTNPVLYNYRRPDEIDSIYCMMNSGISLWKEYFPQIPILQKADMMLDAPLSSGTKPALQIASRRRLSVVIIGGVLTVGRLPRIKIDAQLASYKKFLTKLKELGNDVDLFYKGKGSIASDFTCLRDDNGRLFEWNSVMEHPLEIDYPNMIFVSISFGSSALLEGISRGIPAMIVRDINVEDYTLLDPEFIPTGTSDEIIMEISRCLDYDYRMMLVQKQIRYYSEELGMNSTDDQLN